MVAVTHAPADFYDVSPLLYRNPVMVVDQRSTHIFSEEEILQEAQVNLPFALRIIFSIIAIAKDIFFVISIYLHRYFEEKAEYAEAAQLSSNPFDRSEDSLCVCLHGLNASSYGFDSLHDKILEEPRLRNMRVYRPIVPERGNCSLTEAATPILRDIRDWAQAHPDKKIHLIGVSNGGRLAGFLGSHLRGILNVSNPIDVHSMAAPFYGTEVLGRNNASVQHIGHVAWNLLVDCPLTNMFFERVVVEEMRYGANRAKSVIQDMRVAGSNGVSFTFYGSVVDEIVRPLQVCIPKGIPNSRALICETEGHSSIVHGLEQLLIERLLEGR